MIQIRDVPDAILRELEARAARAGQSLSDYLLHEVREIAARPTLEDMLARLSSLPGIELATAAADLVRDERDRR